MLKGTWGQEKIVSVLVENKCAINVQDTEGNTPLNVAILNQHSTLIEILLKQPNIDLKIKNNAGQTPFATGKFQKSLQSILVNA